MKEESKTKYPDCEVCNICGHCRTHNYCLRDNYGTFVSVKVPLDTCAEYELRGNIGSICNGWL